MVRHLTETANIIIANSKLKTIISVRTMLSILLKEIGVSPSFMCTKPTVSEETKLSIINCMNVIFQQITPEVIYKLYTKENLNLLAQVLSISEYILSNEKYRCLRYVLIINIDIK